MALQNFVVGGGKGGLGEIGGAQLTVLLAVLVEVLVKEIISQEMEG